MHWLMQRIHSTLRTLKNRLLEFVWIKQAFIYVQNFYIVQKLLPVGMQVIPKKIHFIWLGSVLPAKYQDNIKTWMHINPDYEFYLWIDTGALPLETIPENLARMQQFCKQNNISLNDVATMPSFKKFIEAPFYNDWLNGYDQTYAFAADNLRLKILYDYGGVYADTDTTCVEPLGTMYNKYGLFSWGNGQYISDNCIIAVTKNHHIISRCCDEMQQHYNKLMLFTLCRDQIVVRKNIHGIDANPEPIPEGYYRIDEKYWEDWAYENLRFQSPINDSRRCSFFGAPVTFATMNHELLRAYGEKGLQQCVFYEKHSVRHTRDNSWASCKTNGLKKKGIIYDVVAPEHVRMNVQLANQRNKATFASISCVVS